MNKNILQKAISIAQDLPDQKYKIVSIITDKKSKILSIGWNSFEKSHPKQKEYAEKAGNKHQIFLHSEIASIINLPYNSKPYAIYVARVNRKGKPLLAKPCIICKNAILDFGINKVYHT